MDHVNPLTATGGSVMVLGVLEGPDLIIVLVILVLLFGANKLPELARGMGHAKREFENAIAGRDTPAPETKVAEAIEPATKSAASEPTTVTAHATSVGSDTAAVSDSVTLSREEYDRLRGLDSAAVEATKDLSR